MMLQGWRWYGPNDPVSLDDIRQAGATDVVTALHQVPIGEAWTRAAVEERKTCIENGPPGRRRLTWSVVESIPIPDDVKRLGGGATRSIEAWIASLEAVAAAGIRIICYNFMPVVDWCRTDLEWELPNGAKAMRFDQDRFAAFDLHILERPGAEAEYSEAGAGTGQGKSIRGDDAGRYRLSRHGHRQRAAWLDHRTADDPAVPRPLAAISRHRSRPCCAGTSVEFLAARDAGRPKPLGVTPDAASGRPAAAAVRPAAHRLDGRRLSALVRRGALEGERHVLLHRLARRRARQTICPRWRKRFAPRIALRPSARHQAGRRYGLSFFESDHLDGDVDMIAVLEALLVENRKRSAGEPDRVPPRSRPPHARRSRGNQAHQSRLHRHRPPARPRRTARRDPGDRARGLGGREHLTLRCHPRAGGDPVRRGPSICHDRLWNTGSPACAGDDTAKN